MIYYAAMKKEYEVLISRVESCVVVVQAEDEDRAKELAVQLENSGNLEYAYSNPRISVHTV